MDHLYEFILEYEIRKSQTIDFRTLEERQHKEWTDLPLKDSIQGKRQRNEKRWSTGHVPQWFNRLGER